MMWMDCRKEVRTFVGEITRTKGMTNVAKCLSYGVEGPRVRGSSRGRRGLDAVADCRMDRDRSVVARLVVVGRAVMVVKVVGGGRNLW